MRVSVLMPTYNQGRFLQRALDALTAQTFTGFELIICDDGSTDDTAAILSCAVANVVRHHRNAGAANAINTAYAKATGELVTWVSSDNVMHPQWLAELVRHLDAHPEHGAVYSAYARIEDDGCQDVHPGPYSPDRLTDSDNCFIGPSFLIRREVWQPHEGGSAHDLNNWLHVEEACWARGMTLGYVDEVLCDYHAGPWCTGRVRPETYDAPKWRAEAIARRSQ